MSTTNAINEKKREIRNLVVGGAGTLIYSYIGAIQTLFTDDDLINIKNLVGTSAGAIVVGLLGCGASKDYIDRKINEVNLKDFADHSSFALVNVYRTIKYYGYNNGDVFLKWVENTLEELTGNKDITFSEQYERNGKNIVISGCNISRNRFRYFNRLNDPNMRIADAIRISMSIPLFYKPYIYEGDMYIDGGTTINYPVSFLATDLCMLLDSDFVNDNKLVSISTLREATYKLYDLDEDVDIESPEFVNNILSKTIGVKTFTKRSLNYIRSENTDNNENLNNASIITYASAVLGMMMDASLREHIDENIWDRTVKIDVSKYNASDFNLPKDTIYEMIHIGSLAASDFLTKHK